MKDINEWYAEKCGVEILSRGFQDNMWRNIGNEASLREYRWTIKDPRCREIIREWLFEQGYVLKAGKALWTYSKLHKDYDAHAKDFHSGKNEIACLKAIYEKEAT